MSLDRNTPLYREVIPRLVSALLYLKLRHPPYPWQIRLCESLVFGELEKVKTINDVGIQIVYDVAHDIDQFIVLYELDNDDKLAECEETYGTSSQEGMPPSWLS